MSMVTRLCQLILLQDSRAVKQQAGRDIQYPYSTLGYLSFLSPPFLLSSTYALSSLKNESNAKIWISEAVAFILNSRHAFPVYAEIIGLNSHIIPGIMT